MRELNSVQARAVFGQLTTDLNLIRWGSVKLTMTVIDALIEDILGQKEGDVQVWVVGADLGNALRCNLQKPTLERQNVANVFDGVETQVPYSIGVMYGMEVLASANVPPNVIILADIGDGDRVLRHCASWLSIDS